MKAHGGSVRSVSSSKRTGPVGRRDSAANMSLDMRLPGRVRAELKSKGGPGKAFREYLDKAAIRPVIVKRTRHATLRSYFESMDRDGGGTLDFNEMRRWLPKIGLDNAEFRAAVQRHFTFMDKDGSDEVDFGEFAKATIDAADMKLSNYADEQYVKEFGMEIYMFLALCERAKALRAFDQASERMYESGNELAPFEQFERLMKSSQAVFMPYELFQPEDGSVKNGLERQDCGLSASASLPSMSMPMPPPQHPPHQPLSGSPAPTGGLGGGGAGAEGGGGGGSSVAGPGSPGSPSSQAAAKAAPGKKYSWADLLSSSGAGERNAYAGLWGLRPTAPEAGGPGGAARGAAEDPQRFVDEVEAELEANREAWAARKRQEVADRAFAARNRHRQGPGGQGSGARGPSPLLPTHHRPHQERGGHGARRTASGGSILKNAGSGAVGGGSGRW